MTGEKLGRGDLLRNGVRMLDWLLKNWALLLLVLAGGAYFCFYVMLARERRSSPDARRRPDKDC